jgi:molybdopterin molybdotransferase
MSDLPGVDEALALVLERARPLAAEVVAIERAAGRVLAVDAGAAVDLPPFDSSAMDGYAVRAADTPGTLPVRGDAAAGSPYESQLGPGEAVAISTGAVVPDGADAVVPVEQAEREGDSVRVEAARPAAHIRRRGGDVRAGEVVGESGMLLGPAQVGALAAAGVASVRCARRPVVAVLATGTELRRPGERLGPGAIYESNTTSIAAQVASAGGVAEILPQVGDDRGETEAAIRRGLAADVLVTSGGVSVGPHDLVRGTLAALGAEEVFWRVAIKPGKPVAFSVHGATLVFGLPGNPVSSLVAFELLVRPALLALQGARRPGPFFLPGTLRAGVTRNAGRDELVRARSEVTPGGVGLAPIVGQESHMIASAFAADALVFVPRGEGTLEEGTTVSYLRI